MYYYNHEPDWCVNIPRYNYGTGSVAKLPHLQPVGVSIYHCITMVQVVCLNRFICMLLVVCGSFKHPNRLS